MKNKNKNSVFIICSVRNADAATKIKLVAYKQKLMTLGYQVHLPHIDTPQDTSGYEICVENTQANIAAKQTHIFFDKTSEGSFFDIGVRLVDMYLHPEEKEFYVMEYLDNNISHVAKGNHLEFFFNQKLDGYNFWIAKLESMMKSEIIPISYLPRDIQQSHMKLGIAFALCKFFPEKRIKVIHNRAIMDEYGQYFIIFERSFGTMLVEWEERQKK